MVLFRQFYFLKIIKTEVDQNTQNNNSKCQDFYKTGVVYNAATENMKGLFTKNKANSKDNINML